MKIFFYLLIILFCFISCRDNPSESKFDIVKKVYSKNVKDSFNIFIKLPDNYFINKDKYSVVYILDANLYFDIFSSTIQNYSLVDLLPLSILVGIGYKDLQTMDSLRGRDYTFPGALPEYEMNCSGKADNFLSFINDELVPEIDSLYRSDKKNRILMGHSLGGYFTLYALVQNLKNKNTLFTGYLSASPSVHYNNYYMLHEFECLGERDKNVKLYTTFGGLENTEEEDSVLIKSEDIIKQMRLSLDQKVNFKGDLFSELGHMDTQFPTFVKGLRWAQNKQK